MTRRSFRTKQKTNRNKCRKHIKGDQAEVDCPRVFY
jgi:hypothetical protein